MEMYAEEVERGREWVQATDMGGVPYEGVFIPAPAEKMYAGWAVDQLRDEVKRVAAERDAAIAERDYLRRVHAETIGGLRSVINNLEATS